MPLAFTNFLTNLATPNDILSSLLSRQVDNLADPARAAAATLFYGLTRGSAGNSLLASPDRNSQPGFDAGAYTVGRDPVQAAEDRRNRQVPGGSPGGATSQGNSLTSGDIQSGSSGVNQWAPQINDAAKQTGTPAAVIAAIMEGESEGNAGAYSPDGAVGLMQVMPQYWSDLAKQFGGDLSDPRVNILVGATILKQNHDRAVKAYGSDDAKAWDIAAAAYLGDWSWDKGSYAGNSDAYGTNGSEYVNRFHQNLQKFGGLTASLTQDNRSSSAIGSSNQAIQTAQQFVGQPYVWGGASPKSGFDCSGLVQWSYAQSGYKLPRTAQEQYDATQRVSADQLKPGDLVFFTGTYNAGVPVTHVGIYVGNGKMLDSQNDGIVYDDLSSPYWQSHLYGYGRVT